MPPPHSAEPEISTSLSFTGEFLETLGRSFLIGQRLLGISRLKDSLRRRLSRNLFAFDIVSKIPPFACLQNLRYPKRGIVLLTGCLLTGPAGTASSQVPFRAWNRFEPGPASSLEPLRAWKPLRAWN